MTRKDYILIAAALNGAMSYVIQRTDQGGGFVTPPGSGHSYTQDMRKARIFGTREAAEGGRCPDNEVVRSVDALLYQGGR